MKYLVILASAFLFSCSNTSVAEQKSEDVKKESNLSCSIFSTDSDKQCIDGSFCFYDIGLCKDSSKLGVCKEKKQICTKIYKPVCGCDNKTYPNECVAHSFGISIKDFGSCNK